MASSIGPCFASRIGTRAAIRGEGILPANEVRIAPACAPDTRATEIAFGGRPDDRSKMVWSRGCIAYLAPDPLKTQRNLRRSLTDARAADGALLLHDMLQDFRRIYAAKRSLAPLGRAGLV